MIRATYASQDNLERFLACIFGEGRAEVSVSALVNCVQILESGVLTVRKVGSRKVPVRNSAQAAQGMSEVLLRTDALIRQ